MDCYSEKVILFLFLGGSGGGIIPLSLVEPQRLCSLEWDVSRHYHLCAVLELHICSYQSRRFPLVFFSFVLSSNDLNFSPHKTMPKITLKLR